LEIKKPVSVRLSHYVDNRLHALEEATGRTKTFYVKEAIEVHLEELEERYWADKVAARWEASDRQTRPASKLWAELNI
jgi:RHH-type rel operon transcriptional repressor/antitoxin RelB